MKRIAVIKRAADGTVWSHSLGNGRVWPGRFLNPRLATIWMIRSKIRSWLNAEIPLPLLGACVRVTSNFCSRPIADTHARIPERPTPTAIRTFASRYPSYQASLSAILHLRGGREHGASSNSRFDCARCLVQSAGGCKRLAWNGFSCRGTRWAAGLIRIR